jgi:hypothetical protein
LLGALRAPRTAMRDSNEHENRVSDRIAVHGTPRKKSVMGAPPGDHGTARVRGGDLSMYGRLVPPDEPAVNAGKT